LYYLDLICTSSDLSIRRHLRQKLFAFVAFSCLDLRVIRARFLSLFLHLLTTTPYKINRFFELFARPYTYHITLYYCCFPFIMASSQGLAGPSSDNAQGQDLAIRSAGLHISGTPFKTAEEAWALAKQLPAEQMFSEMRRIHENALHLQSSMEDFVLELSAVSDAEAKTVFSGDTLEAFISESAAFQAKAQQIKTARASVNTAINSLRKSLDADTSSLRAKSLFQLVTTDPSHSKNGRNFFQNLYTLSRIQLINKTPIHAREAVRAINMMTIRRCKKLDPYQRSSLKPVDVETAMKHVQTYKGKELVLDVLEAAILRELGFTFGEAGVLVKLPYNGEPFPVFEDEGSLELVVVVEPASVAESSATALGGGLGLDDVDFGAFLQEEIVTAGVEKGKGRAVDAVEGLESGSKEVDGEELGRGKRKRADPVVEETESDSGEDEEEIVLAESPAKKARTAVPVTPQAKAAPFPDPVTPAPKTPKTPKSNPRGKIYDFLDCECDMDIEWKTNFALWPELDFEDQCSLLEPIHMRAYHGEGLYRTPCERHLRCLAELLQMEYVKPLSVMLDRFSDVRIQVSERTSFRLAWVHPHTRDFFKATDEILAHRKIALVPGRFRPREPEPLPLPAPSALSLDFKGTKAWVSIENPLTLAPTFVKDCLLEEINMLRWHTREGQDMERSWLANSYFTLTAQLLWADPMVWHWFHSVYPGNPTSFLAHPLPVRVFEAGTQTHTLYEGDTDRLSVSSCYILELVLQGGACQMEFITPGESGDFFKMLKRSYCRQDRVFFTKDNSGALDDYLSDHPFAARTETMKALGVHLRKAGTLVRSLFSESKFQGTRISVPICLLPVDGQGVCENLVGASILRESHAKLEAPKLGLFRGNSSDVSFPASVRVRGLGGLSEMHCGSAKPDDLAVRTDVAKWLKYGSNTPTGKKQLLAWRAAASTMVAQSFEYLKAEEMSRFGENSYFAREQGRILVEDPEYIEISDEE
jgi:hypothetical protein